MNDAAGGERRINNGVPPPNIGLGSCALAYGGASTSGERRKRAEGEGEKAAC